ncbi:hypothetical protein PV341_22450 [Streptomyces sp. PA03-1a]|nr:hypothetical protein [Streptomyces sp. PA03-1a]MDX2815239.1 hypothetical protein [Streptomyces sp. PA03-5A]
MGIELELHSGRPARKGTSRGTLLRGSYEHGEALARVLGTLGRHDSGKLGWVDPTATRCSTSRRLTSSARRSLFNEQEAHVVRQEVAVLTQRCTDEEQKAALLDLAELLEACAATPGSYLWFMGD